MKLLTTMFAAVLVLGATPALATEQATTVANANAAFEKAGLPYRAREAVTIEVPAQTSATPSAAPTDLKSILAAVFPGIKFTVVDTDRLSYVKLEKNGKTARTGISGTTGELIGRLNGLVKYLGG